MGVNDSGGHDKLQQFLAAGGSADVDSHLFAWCAAAVNAALAKAGIPGTGSAGVRSFDNWGQSVDPSQVQRGDVLVYKNDKHVGLATGQTETRDGQEWIQMVAGNERDPAATAAGLAGPGRSQVGQVGTHWMPASELNVRRYGDADTQKADETLAELEEKKKILDDQRKAKEEREGGTPRERAEQAAEADKVKGLGDELKAKQAIVKADQDELKAAQSVGGAAQGASQARPGEAGAAEGRRPPPGRRDLVSAPRKARGTGDPKAEHDAATALAQAKMDEAKRLYGADSAEYLARRGGKGGGRPALRLGIEPARAGEDRRKRSRRRARRRPSSARRSTTPCRTSGSAPPSGSPSRTRSTSRRRRSFRRSTLRSRRSPTRRPSRRSRSRTRRPTPSARSTRKRPTTRARPPTRPQASSRAPRAAS